MDYLSANTSLKHRCAIEPKDKYSFKMADKLQMLLNIVGAMATMAMDKITWKTASAEKNYNLDLFI